MKKAKSGVYGNGSITPRKNAKGGTYYTVRYKGYCTTVNNYVKAQKKLDELRERDKSGLRMTNYEIITKEFANDPVRFLLKHNLNCKCIFLKLNIHGNAPERCGRYSCCDKCISDWLSEEVDIKESSL